MPVIVTTDYAPLDPTAKRILVQGLRRDADEMHSQHSQYAGKFDTWVLHIITGTEVIPYKSGAVLRPGRIVLADPNLSINEGCPVTRSAYDPNTGHVLAVPHESIRRI